MPTTSRRCVKVVTNEANGDIVCRGRDEMIAKTGDSLAYTYLLKQQNSNWFLFVVDATTKNMSRCFISWL